MRLGGSLSWSPGQGIEIFGMTVTFPPFVSAPISPCPLPNQYLVIKLEEVW